MDYEVHEAIQRALTHEGRAFDRRSFTDYYSKRIGAELCLLYFFENNKVPADLRQKIDTNNFIEWLDTLGYGRGRRK